jgi:hypothetical protein
LHWEGASQDINGIMERNRVTICFQLFAITAL